MNPHEIGALWAAYEDVHMRYVADIWVPSALLPFGRIALDKKPFVFLRDTREWSVVNMLAEVRRVAGRAVKPSFLMPPSLQGNRQKLRAAFVAAGFVSKKTEAQWYSQTPRRRTVKTDLTIKPLRSPQAYLDLSQAAHGMHQPKINVTRMMKKGGWAQHLFYGAYAGRTLVGINAAYYHGGVAGLQSLGVLPDWRGHGAAAALNQTVLNALTDVKVTSVLTAVAIDNQPSHRVQLKTGFTPLFKTEDWQLP